MVPTDVSGSICDEGWLTTAVRCPSPNCNDRPCGQLIDLVVVHNISLPPTVFGGDFIEAFFCNRLDFSEHPYFATIAHLQVSAHCLVKRDGQVIQFVPFLKRAWHAGASEFEGRCDCNDFSIGIELEGADHTPYEPAQYHALSALIGCISAKYPSIIADNIVGHSDIAPGRKTDPGPAFDWPYLRRLLSHNA